MFSRCFLSELKPALAVFIVLIMTWSSAQADLILTAPPRENKAKGKETYGPLATQLSKELGTKVIYQQPKGWLFYQRDMRAKKFDIVFDGPHFMSWRMKAIGHKPVAMLPGKLGFIIVTKKDNNAIKTIDDLTNRKLCAISPPNLSTLTVLAEMPNPVRQPALITGKGGMKGVWNRYTKGKCDAAILRDKFFAKKVSKEQQAENKIIFKSVPIANQGITVGPNVTDEMKSKIQAVLTKEGSPGVVPILKRFAGKAKSMKPVPAKIYDKNYELLTGVVFGWEVDGRYQ